MFSPYYYVGAVTDPATIAILGLEVVGAVDLKSIRVARELTNALRSRAASGPYTIAPNSDKELIDQLVMHNCPDVRKECMTKIGRALHVNHLLYGRVTRRSQAPGGYQISLWLLAVQSGHLASWADFVPAADASSTRLADRARQGYARLIAGSSGEQPTEQGSPPRPVADRGLTDTTNAAFWALTKYKPGHWLNMSDPQDREMSKTWRQIHEDLKGRRQRAVNRALRTLNETVTPYVLVTELRNGSLTSQAFPRRSNLDVQYSWILDQPERYTYIAAFDFTQDRNAPVSDQFALTRRSQVAGWLTAVGIAG